MLDRSKLVVDLTDTRCAHRELEERLRPFVARRVPGSDIDDVLQLRSVYWSRDLP